MGKSFPVNKIYLLSWRRNSEKFLFTAILTIAIWLRFYRLGEASLWQDEAHSWWIARLPWLDMVEALLGIGVHPPLYFLALKGSMLILGESEFGLRVISVLFDAFALFLVVWIGKYAGGKIGMVIACWFWAFHPMTLWYARETRPYALASFLAVAGLALFLFQRRRGFSPWSYLLSYIVLTFGLFSHYYYFLVIGALMLLALSDFWKSPGFFRRWTLIAIAAILTLGAWLTWFFLQPAPSLGIGWIQKPGFLELPRSFWNIFSGYGGVISLPAIFFGFITVGLASFGLFHGRDVRFTRSVFFFGLLLPIISVWLVSQRRPIYMDRYFIILLPFALLLVTSGASAAWEIVVNSLPRWSLPIAGGFTLFMLLIGIWTGITVSKDEKFAREDWRGLTTYLDQHSEDIPEIWLSDPESLVPFQYYSRRDFRLLSSTQPFLCEISCWWVLRQPYTATHAFTQAVSTPGRPWIPPLPPSCAIKDRWDSPTGLALLHLHCVN